MKLKIVTLLAFIGCCLAALYYLVSFGDFLLEYKLFFFSFPPLTVFFGWLFFSFLGWLFLGLFFFVLYQTRKGKTIMKLKTASILALCVICAVVLYHLYDTLHLIFSSYSLFDSLGWANEVFSFFSMLGWIFVGLFIFKFRSGMNCSHKIPFIFGLIGVLLLFSHYLYRFYNLIEFCNSMDYLSSDVIFRFVKEIVLVCAFAFEIAYFITLIKRTNISQKE